MDEWWRGGYEDAKVVLPLGFYYSELLLIALMPFIVPFFFHSQKGKEKDQCAPPPPA